jgi:hypothetical protein
VSFLEQLKQQARTLHDGDPLAPEALMRNQRLANEACRIADEYWKELAQQLNVIRTPSAARYVLDGRNALQGLACRNFRVSPHLRLVPGGASQYDSVALVWQAAGTARIRVEKELPNDVERLRTNLRQAGIAAHESSVLNPSTGRARATAFEFVPEVSASVRVAPLPESGRVRLTFTNVDQIERVEAEYPAVGLRAKLLDDIGRWIVGQPHRVLEYASDVKRYQH